MRGSRDAGYSDLAARPEAKRDAGDVRFDLDSEEPGVFGVALTGEYGRVRSVRRAAVWERPIALVELAHVEGLHRRGGVQRLPLHAPARLPVGCDVARVGQAGPRINRKIGREAVGHRHGGIELAVASS